MKLKFCKTLCFLMSFSCIIIFSGMTNVKAATSTKPTLAFDSSGNFKIVQFSDIQDGPNTNPNTLALMNKILDYEKPNLVILTGDNIDGRCTSAADVQKAITNIAQPMETRKIPWAIVFGNHDDEHGKMTKTQMMNFYMTFSCNLSQIGYKTYDRIGNYNLLVKSSKSTTPVFNIYMLDSGKYFSGGYDYIKTTQIDWYKKTASSLKTKYGKTIPAFMFFHIPLPEYYTAFQTGYVDGERYETECSPTFNSGLFSTVVKTGDVKGVFVGHDHANTYSANLNGIRLGYAGSVGYATYTSSSLLRGRGARVFQISEANPSSINTWLRCANDVELNPTSIYTFLSSSALSKK